LTTSFDELDEEAVEKVSILVVDDLPEKLLVIETILEDLGQKLVVVRSGADALREVLRQEFAVILLDVNMPGMDGLETARLIRTHRRSAHTPIIFVTAYVDEMQTAQGYSLGAVDYILSPVIPEVLRSKVRVFVELHIGQRRLRAQARERIALVAAEAAQRAAEAGIRRSNFLSHASRVLAGSLEVEVGMQRLLELVVPEVAAKAVLVLFADSRGTARAMHCEATDPGVAVIGGRALGEGGVELLPAPVQEALHLLSRSGDVSDQGVGAEPSTSARYVLGKHTLVPMSTSDQALGALVIEQPREGLDWTMLDELANRAAMALENARLYRNLQVEIDERRQAQAKLLEINQRKDEFLAMLSHELRNPLAPIRNAVEVIRRLTPHADKRVTWATDVTERQVNQLTRLVEELLDVARISQGKIALKLDVIDLRTVLAQAVETVRSLIDKRHHRLTVDLPGQPVWLQGDFTRLSQVVANLLNNAAKYTQEGGEIELALSVGEQHALVRVRDNGAGIEPDLLPHVFELFEQGKRSLDRSQGGLGVGLTLVQRLVDLHHGQVSATSAGSGQGAEFFVVLPGVVERQVPVEEAPSAEAAQPTTVDSCRVLVVDDHPDIAQTIAAYLELTGYQVMAASDGPQALDCLSRFTPDVVLLDIGLPGMDGYEVARRLRLIPQLEQALLIALTGYGQLSDRLKAQEAGFNAHIVKPADPQEVEQMIAEWRAGTLVGEAPRAMPAERAA
jgi:CheY-like chemotaxis protein